MSRRRHELPEDVRLEIDAMQAIVAALESLDEAARERVLSYTISRFRRGDYAVRSSFGGEPET